LLVTTDALIEDIHFNTSHTTADLLGKKSISVNLSDIAAMGGTPLCCVVTLAVPPQTSCEFVKRLYRGMCRQLRRFGAALVGGDTSATQGKITISVALLGTARRRNIVYRHGARAGDIIYVTGFPGEAALGLMLLTQHKNLAHNHPLIQKHLDPVPRIYEGKKISERGLAHSMIDISDGVLADLQHILDESCVGATVWLDRLPLSPRYKRCWAALSEDMYAPALCGGEDYELLFTVSARKKKQLETLAQTLAIPVTSIGEITGQTRKLTVLDTQGNEVVYDKQGYSHF
jgi:thiamine-monophosphate kinase